MTDVEREREACAKQVEGRAIFHRKEGDRLAAQGKSYAARDVRTAAKEATAIASAIRSRTYFPYNDGDGLEIVPLRLKK